MYNFNPNTSCIAIILSHCASRREQIFECHSNFENAEMTGYFMYLSLSKIYTTWQFNIKWQIAQNFAKNYQY